MNNKTKFKKTIKEFHWYNYIGFSSEKIVEIETSYYFTYYSDLFLDILNKYPIFNS